MKNSKLRRILLTLACAVLLVSLSVGATLAYLTSTTDVVQNTFTVGKVEIDLDEVIVDENGEIVTMERVKANSYKLMPGHTYTKDPTVHVTEGSEDCYIFVRVKNDIEAIEDKSNANLYPTIEQQMTANGWVALDGVPGVYYFTKNGSSVWTASMGLDLTVFTSFKISPDVLNGVEEDEREEGKLYITDYVTADKGTLVTVIAYAIQADGFNSPAEAWTAGNW